MILNLSTGGAVPGALKKPVIVVTYPYEALCTVTNGEKTYRAPDASGSASFLVDPGTWTVMITRADGTVVSQGVVAAPGKWYQVELTFFTGLVYENGVEHSPLTFVNNEAEIFSVEKGEASLKLIKADTSVKASAFLYTAVDVSDFSTLTIEYLPADISTSFFYGALHSSPAPTYDSLPEASVQLYQATTARQTATLDVSAYYGLKYVGIFCRAYSAMAQTNEFYKIELT